MTDTASDAACAAATEQALADLARDFDTATVAQLAATFLASAAQGLAELQAHAPGEAAAKRAHTLKGMARNLGVTVLAERAAAAEQALSSADPGWPQRVAELEASYGGVEPVLRRWADGAPA